MKIEVTARVSYAQFLTMRVNCDHDNSPQEWIVSNILHQIENMEPGYQVVSVFPVAAYGLVDYLVVMRLKGL